MSRLLVNISQNITSMQINKGYKKEEKTLIIVDLQWILAPQMAKPYTYYDKPIGLLISCFHTN